MAPDDERLGRLIGAAFDRLPEPAPARLKAVEDRLAVRLVRREKQSRPGWYWWLMAALAAGAGAAWWAGGYFGGEPRKEDLIPPVLAPTDETPPQSVRETGVESPNVESPAQTNEPSLIYRRERY